MAIKVVTNKKLDMTEDEWILYQKIIKSYTTITNKGEDLFIDLFETDDNGIIVFLRPPSRRQTSLEVFLFLMSLMQHQHLRVMHQQIDEAVAVIKAQK
jgi:hypothetical protein